MRQYQKILRIRTRSRSLHDITGEVHSATNESGINTGLCSLYVRHTSASLVIQENADPDVLRDLERFFWELVPESEKYYHSTEGPDDMPSHIRSALTNTSEQIPISHGTLMLGTWQGIYLWEHRAFSHNRELVIHIVGD